MFFFFSYIYDLDTDEVEIKILLADKSQVLHSSVDKCIITFRGIISGREVINMLKIRVTGPFNDISAICLKRLCPLFDVNTGKSRVRALLVG